MSPKKEIKKENCTIQLESDLIEKIDELARKMDLTRSQLLRNFINEGYHDTSILYAVGLIPAVQAIHKINDYKSKIFMELTGKTKD